MKVVNQIYGHDFLEKALLGLIYNSNNPFL